MLAKSAEQGCAKNCRLLLEQQVGLAQREIRTRAPSCNLIDSKPSVSLPMPRPHSRMHRAPRYPERRSRIGWGSTPPSSNDHRGLGAFGANGLAACLIAFAAHGRREYRVPELTMTPIAAVETPRKTKTVVRDAEHAAQFAVEALTPAHDDGADLLEIHSAYQNWCRTKGVEALPAAKIGAALSRLFDGTGITVGERDGRRVAMGVAVKSQPKRKALGRMVTVGAANANGGAATQEKGDLCVGTDVGRRERSDGNADGTGAYARIWRMGWDSNPRWACTHAGFQDRCLKPLGHPSRARAPTRKVRAGAGDPIGVSAASQAAALLPNPKRDLPSLRPDCARRDRAWLWAFASGG